MAFDETLAARLRAVIADRDELSKRRMFGGLAFLLGGICVAASMATS